MHAINRLVQLFSALLILLSACTAPPPTYVPCPDSRIPSTCDGTRANLLVATFNAGDGPGMVAHSAARRPEIVKAVSAMLTRADVVIGQEFWDPETIRQIASTAGLPKSQVLWADTRGMNESSKDTCKNAHGPFRRVRECALAKCGTADIDEAATCVAKQCRRQLTWLYLANEPCFVCLLSQTGTGVRFAIAACENGSGSQFQKGMNSLVIFSRLPVRDARFLALPSSYQNGGALMATLTTRNGADVAIMDVHVPAAAPVPPRQSDATDWEDAKAQYIDATLRSFRAYAGNKPRLYGGDMNFSVGNGTSLDGAYEWQWAVVRRSGYTDPAANAWPQFCTACPYPENLTRKRSSRSREHIDKVFLSDPPGGARADAVCAERVFDEPMILPDGAGKEEWAHLSDHFGTLVGFAVEPGH